jgi:hypothetical protein
MYNGVIRKMSECPNLQTNLKNCPCTYSCDLKGKCCECLRNHRANNELPACYFLPEVEKTYDRSIRKFLATRKGGKTL